MFSKQKIDSLGSLILFTFVFLWVLVAKQCLAEMCAVPSRISWGVIPLRVEWILWLLSCPGGPRSSHMWACSSRSIADSLQGKVRNAAVRFKPCCLGTGWHPQYSGDLSNQIVRESDCVCASVFKANIDGWSISVLMWSCLALKCSVMIYYFCLYVNKWPYKNV